MLEYKPKPTQWVLENRIEDISYKMLTFLINTTFPCAAKTSSGFRSCEQASDSTREKGLPQDHHSLKHSQ